MGKGKEKPGLKKQRGWTWEEDHLRVVRSIARTGPGCHEGCGVLLYVEDGKLVKVEGDLEVPFNQGRLCTRCLVLPEVIYHTDHCNFCGKRLARGLEPACVKHFQPGVMRFGKIEDLTKDMEEQPRSVLWALH